MFIALGFADFVKNGLKVIEKVSNAGPYHLILLDNEMSEIEADKTATQIRTVSKSQMPIIGMTGY